MINLFLVVLEDLLFGNDIGPEVRFQSIALIYRQFVTRLHESGTDLGLQVEMFRQHPHTQRGRVTHGLSRLVQPFAWRLPVQDPHLQKIKQNLIVHDISVEHQEILVRSDHVRPKEIIVVKVEEAVSPPPFLNHKLISILFPSKANSIGATPEDL